MILRGWEKLPENMQVKAVKPYYEILAGKRISLMLKRFFDCLLSFILFIVLIPLLMLIAVGIKLDSKGKIFFTQCRVTAYGRKFDILKFRTMVDNAEHLGPNITADRDARITRTGRLLRKYRLDEIPQLINVLKGEMTFVGTRPEAPKFVEHYTDEMKATLLLPAGITSKASIMFKDESALLAGEKDIESTYIRKILPIKMKYNLEALKEFSFLSDIAVMIQTVLSFSGFHFSIKTKSDNLSNDSEADGPDAD